MVSIIWLVAAIKQSATGVVLWGVVLLTKVAVRLATGGTSADRRVTALVDNHLLQESAALIPSVPCGSAELAAAERLTR